MPCSFSFTSNHILNALLIVIIIVSCIINLVLDLRVLHFALYDAEQYILTYQVTHHMVTRVKKDPNRNFSLWYQYIYSFSLSKAKIEHKS